MQFSRSRAIFLEHQLNLQAAEIAQKICFCLVRLNRAREAYELAGEAVAFFRSFQHRRHDLALSLMYQAEAAMLEGNYGDAENMLQEARTLLEEVGFIAQASMVRLHLLC